jgi:F-type H+-transporting ATPase subunit epsilon
MAHTMHVLVATVADTLYNDVADSVTVPSSGGEMTLLAHHEPVISTLKKGTVTIKTHEGTKKFPVTHGVLEVANNTVHILL